MLIINHQYFSQNFKCLYSLFREEIQVDTNHENDGLKSVFFLAYNTHTHTRLTALFPGLPRWASTRKVKPIWILLKQETVSGSGISWAICKPAPCSRQITTPATHHSVFYRPDALPAAQPTASKHWREFLAYNKQIKSDTAQLQSVQNQRSRNNLQSCCKQKTSNLLIFSSR